MIEIIYPIIGVYRPILLLLEWCFATICSEMGIMFCVKYFKARAQRNVQDLGFSALCFGLSVSWFSQITSDYFIEGTHTLTFGIWNGVNLGTFIWCIGFFGVISGGFVFSILLERYIIFVKKYFVTTVYAVCASIFTILLVINVTSARLFAFVISFLIIGFLFAFIWDLAKKVRNKPGYTQVAFESHVSVVIFAIGCFLTVDFYLNNFGLEIRLLGICLLLGSFLSLCIILLRFPAVALLNWKTSLEELFLISRAGMCFVQKSFGAHARVLDDSIATSAISMVNMLIKEMVASGEQGLSKVKKINKVIFIFSSSLVTGAVISNEDNPAIPPKLKLLVHQFEDLYGGIIQNWNGDGRVFGPVETIVEEIFSA